MLSSKRQKNRPESSNSSPSHNLFADYPYPIINQLTEKQKRELERESKHRLSTLASLEWHRANFRKILSLLHDQSPSSVFAESLRQARINDRSSKSMVNNLKKLSTTTTRVQRILASSMSSPLDDKNAELQQRRTHRRLKSKLEFSINDDKG